MNKVKIGILPTSHLFENDNPYDDKYTFVNSYCTQISNSGGIPVGILLNNNEIDEASLEMCDAFLICGGNKIQPYAFQTIIHAIKNNKPLLGICLGMQTIGLYSFLESRLIEKGLPLEYKNFIQEYENIKAEKIYFLNPVEGHYNTIITRNEYTQNKHYVHLNTESVLYDIYKCDTLDVLSMHNYSSALIGDNVLINCQDESGIIEGLEYNNNDLFIIGVQWHPEIEEEHNKLFKRLIKEAQRRKH